MNGLCFSKIIAAPLIKGTALHGSNKNYIQDGNNFGNPNIPGKSFNGRKFYYGIREHAMGTMLNCMAYYGLHIPSGSTFLVFSDYMRAAIRVAALSELQTSYILTHDSVGVGAELGPVTLPFSGVVARSFMYVVVYSTAWQHTFFWW